jgi:hypothetical protein
LDENTFETIKTLPNMPGAVNDPNGGRTYQLEGSMVLLPQHAPYTDNLEVLICGGSTANGMLSDCFPFTGALPSVTISADIVFRRWLRFG